MTEASASCCLELATVLHLKISDGFIFKRLLSSKSTSSKYLLFFTTLYLQKLTCSCDQI